MKKKNDFFVCVYLEEGNDSSLIDWHCVNNSVLYAKIAETRLETENKIKMLQEWEATLEEFLVSESFRLLCRYLSR